MSFIKNKEDFWCENCGIFVPGNGFTNHCPECLWSKHVDKDPGDREEACHGMMKPVEIVLKNKVYSIFHECQKCGAKKKNKMSERDNFGSVLDVLKSQN